VELTFDLGPGDDRLFIDESLEQIQTIESGLLDLERGVGSPQVVNEIFRGAHTLKGSAATIGHRRMAELTHALEDVFGALRAGTLAELGAFADIALSTIDVLRALVEEVSAGRILTDAPDGLTVRLRAMLDAASGAGATVTGRGATPTTVGADAAAAGATPSGAGAAPSRAPSVSSQAAVTPAGRDQSAADRVVERLVHEAPAASGPRSIVRCSIDPSSTWQAVRLLQASVEAGESGHLLAGVPSVEEIEGGMGDLSLTLLLTGVPSDLDALVARLRTIDDIAEVTAELLESRTVESGQPSPSGDRRDANLGPEARGLAPDTRLELAGDRLKSAQQTIRIDVSRLDELMNLVGELVVHKTRLQLQAHQLMGRLGDDPIARAAEEGAQQFARIASQLQDQVTGLRMLPIETIFNRFPRVVRDLAAKLGKDVELVLEGKETELDRSVLEEVGDPLGHLVRNALDHGVEMPEARRAAGKPAAGRLRLSARHAEGHIVITVEDDGAGMDPDTLRRSAVAKSLLTPDAAAALTDAEALRIIFLPGFSTAARVTDVSGRGVGMDVVRTNIERLGGRVDISSTVGTGTRVDLSLPLTLAILGAMLVRSGGRVCALPMTGVVETLRIEPGAISRVARHPMITLRGRVVPVAVLDTVLGDPAHALQPNGRGFINLVVVRSRDLELALAVDEFIGQQEIVLKSLSAFTGRLVGISGATIMADGTVALVVDIGAVLGASADRLRDVA
jgi:two-component system chemotaxis sensor kinase CheA